MAETELWAGPMGREWALHAEALERQLAPVGALALVELAARPGERVLDLGCGSGATTAALAAAVAPAGLATGIDVSADQIAAARARPGAAAAEFLVADAQTHRFPAARYDALFSRFGCMFFADPPAAFGNLRRALKPGARVVLAAWCGFADNPWAALPARAGAEVLGPAEPPAAGVPGPFAWADPATFRPILESAGFSSLAWRAVPVELQIGQSEPADDPVARATAMLMRVGPLARRLREQPDDLRKAVAARLAEALAPHVQDGWVRLAGLTWLITARA